MPDNFINQDDIDEFMLKRMKTMSLKNKPIRFCDNPEQEELGLVEAESSTTLLIRVEKVLRVTENLRKLPE